MEKMNKEKRGRPKTSPDSLPQAYYDIIPERDQKTINKNIQERVENWDHEKWRSKTKG
jgi:hypothetical protein